MEKQMTNPTESQFELNKVKLIKNGGLEAIYNITEIVGNETFTNEYHVKVVKDVHPDLMQCFKELRPIMARMFNLTSFLTIAESNEFDATDEQKAKAREYAEELIDNIEVRGVTYHGTAESLKVILTGLYRFQDGMKSAINTPNILTAEDKYGFEEKLDTIVTKIENEVYQFLFKGKRAQQELFGEDAE